MLTLKLEKLERNTERNPKEARTYRYLQDVAAEVANYQNQVVDAEWAKLRGYVVRQAQPLAVRELEAVVEQRDAVIREVKKLLSSNGPDVEAAMLLLAKKRPAGRMNEQRETRARYSGRLSGDVYVPAETRARAAMSVAVKKGILGGWSGKPHFDSRDSLCVRGAGVKFFERGVDQKGNPLYAVTFNLLKKGEGTPEEYRRVTLNVVKHSARDRYQGMRLASMAAGETRILDMRLIFRRRRGDIYLQISYKREVLVPAFGERVATLGPLDTKHDRLTVRVWHDGEKIVEPKDFSRRLFHMREQKDEYDTKSRRQRYSIGRSKGSRRLLRAKLEDSFSKWAHQLNHRWSAEIISWLATQGVCRLDVFPIGDRDWPSYELIQMLRDKGSVVGIDVEEVTMDSAPAEDEVTYKAALAETKKKQRRAGKMREAVRTLKHGFAQEG